MDFDVYSVDAYVKGEKNGVYHLKIEIPELGIYIHGATLRESKKFEGMWLQPPKKILPDGTFKADVEFSTHTELWKSMFNASVKALNEWRRNENL